VGLRDKLKRLERAVEEETIKLACGECGEEFTVAVGTDLALLVHEWALGAGAEPQQPTPPDVLLLTEHACRWEALEVKETGEPWPLSDVGGGAIGLTIR
jgi:hypothetical protein